METYHVKYSSKKIIHYYLQVLVYCFPFYIMSIVETTIKYKPAVIVSRYISIFYIALVLIFFIKDFFTYRNSFFLKLDQENLQINKEIIDRKTINSISLFHKIASYTYFFVAYPEKKTYKKHYLNIHFDNESKLIDLNNIYLETDYLEIFKILEKNLNNNSLNS